MSEQARRGLWDFSVACYRQRRVETLCLRLQDRHGLNVNVVLGCCWLGFSGRGQVGAPALRHALDCIAPWHERVVLRLRAARRRVKDALPGQGYAALYRELLRAELAAEHVEQLLLEQLLDAAVPRSERTARRRRRDARSSLARAAQSLHAVDGPELRRTLDALVDAIAAPPSPAGGAGG